MMEAGWSARRVACQIGRSDCVVRRCWDKWIREMSFTRRPGSGRPRQTSCRREDSHIAPGLRTFGNAAPITCAALDAHPSTPPFEVVLRTKNWTTAKWNQVVFSDESRFNLSSDNNRVRVWRPRGERLNPAFALQRHTAPTAGVMVWSAIAYNRLAVIPSIDPWQHDSPAQGCRKTVSALLLPFLSLPDSSPIEHIWGKKESQNENEETKLIRNDFAHYVGTPIDAYLREQILKLGPYQPEGNFQKDAKERSFSSSYYSFISKARQKIERKWLCYSTRLHVAYCQVCWLFADRTNMYFKEAWCKGVNDWQGI
ncbi:transposable element Tcb2 transposase [Trichonephila clavipes]|nr:transposable element Tcb2 transposase [Trichonephila clavipes]